MVMINEVRDTNEGKVGKNEVYYYKKKKIIIDTRVREVKIE